MDSIISENTYTSNNETNIYNNICKLTSNGLSHPKYYKLDNSNNCVILNEDKLLSNKSVIYGGVELAC